MIPVNIFFQPQRGTEAFTCYMVKLRESIQYFHFFPLKTDVKKMKLSDRLNQPDAK